MGAAPCAGRSLHMDESTLENNSGMFVWMSFYVRKGFLGHWALAVIAEFAGSLGKRQPIGASDFMPHRCRNVIDLAGLIFGKKERYDLERLYVAGPFAHIDILD